MGRLNLLGGHAHPVNLLFTSLAQRWHPSALLLLFLSSLCLMTLWQHATTILNGMIFLFKFREKRKRTFYIGRCTAPFREGHSAKIYKKQNKTNKQTNKQTNKNKNKNKNKKQKQKTTKNKQTTNKQTNKQNKSDKNSITIKISISS